MDFQAFMCIPLQAMCDYISVYNVESFAARYPLSNVQQALK